MMHLKNRILAILFFYVLSVFIVSCGEEQTESPIIVRVGQEVFTIEDLRQSFPYEAMDYVTREDIQEFITKWINKQLLYQEGVRLGYNETPDIERNVEEYRQTLIANTYIDTYIDSVMSLPVIFPDTVIQNYYEKHSDDFMRQEDEKYLKHILMPTKSSADSVRRILRSGQQTFDSLAAQIAELQNRPRDEWDIGYVTDDMLINDITRTIRYYSNGRISNVIQTDFGYHIVQVIDKKSQGTVRELDEVKPQIIERLQHENRQETYRRHLGFLKNGAAIETNFQLLESQPIDSLFTAPSQTQGDN